MLEWRLRVEQALADGEHAVPRLCDLCAAVLDVSGVGVSLTTKDTRLVLHASDARSALVEELQLTLGEGPCIDTLTTGTPVLIPDLAEAAGLTRDRWSAFLPLASEAGIQAVFAFPLRVGAIRIGALDAYRELPGPLSREDMTAFWIAADALTQTLLSHTSDAAGPIPPMGRYEAQIHQATGMVQGQLGGSTAEALLRLRAHAFVEGRPLRDVAAEVVSRRLRFAPEEPHA